MEWIPKPEGIKELIKLFNESRGSNNAKHREVFEVKIFFKIYFYTENKFLLQKQRIHKLLGIYFKQ